MNILNPPKNYIDFRCAVHGLDGREYDEAKAKFYKAFNCKEEVVGFYNWLCEEKQKMSLPVEKIEVREDDHKKHGRVVPMMIYDIDYWREHRTIKQRKTYVIFERPKEKSIEELPAWVTMPDEEIEPTLPPEDGIKFEKKREEVKIRYPYKEEEG